MNKNTEKILTLSFAIFAFLCGFSLHLILKSFSGAFAIIARLNENDLFKHGLPVAFGFGLFLFLQFNKKIQTWAQEVMIEISRVVFPGRKDVSALTVVVIAFVLISSAIITVFDLLSNFIVKGIIN